jgi:hypothetical protein
MNCDRIKYRIIYRSTRRRDSHGHTVFSLAACLGYEEVAAFPFIGYFEATASPTFLYRENVIRGVAHQLVTLCVIDQWCGIPDTTREDDGEERNEGKFHDYRFSLRFSILSYEYAQVAKYLDEDSFCLKVSKAWAL